MNLLDINLGRLPLTQMIMEDYHKVDLGSCHCRDR